MGILINGYYNPGARLWSGTPWEKSQLLPSRGLQFRERHALIIVIHRGKGSEGVLHRVLWKPRYGAAKLGQFSQMEIVEDLVGIYKLKDGKGRRNSIRVFKGKGIMFLESVIGLALNTQVLKISKQLGNNMSSGSLSSYYTSWPWSCTVAQDTIHNVVCVRWPPLKQNTVKGAPWRCASW